MVNTRMFVFKHPKYYTELRKRNTEAVAKSGKSHASLKSDQVISGANATAKVERAPGPGLSNKQQASHKLVTPRSDQKEVSSNKRR